MWSSDRTSVLLLMLCAAMFSSYAQASTPAPGQVSCASRPNISCDECLKNVSCLWCSPTSQCMDYPAKSIIPSHTDACQLSDSRWGVCWVNFQVLIITTSVLTGMLLLSIAVCCVCCCKCQRIGNKREDAKMEQQARVRKANQKARRAEMQLRHDEIRNKYGLSKDNPYSRMNDH